MLRSSGLPSELRRLFLLLLQVISQIIKDSGFFVNSREICQQQREIARQMCVSENDLPFNFTLFGTGSFEKSLIYLFLKCPRI